MSPKIVNKDEKKREIGEAALTLFAQNGFTSTSMSQVAKAADIGKGTIYEYFKSKDDLVAYSLKLYISAIEESVGGMIGEIKDPVEKLKAYTLNVADKIIADPATTGVVLAIFRLLISSKGNSEQKTPLKGMFIQARQTIEKILDDGVMKGAFNKKAKLESESIAINLIAFLDGIWMHSLVNDEIDLKRQVNYYLDNLLMTIDKKEEDDG